MFELEAGGGVLDLIPRPTDELPSLGDFNHPVQAYLAGWLAEAYAVGEQRHLERREKNL